jgi:hypothetical protein
VFSFGFKSLSLRGGQPRPHQRSVEWFLRSGPVSRLEPSGDQAQTVIWFTFGRTVFLGIGTGGRLAIIVLECSVAMATVDFEPWNGITSEKLMVLRTRSLTRS